MTTPNKGNKALKVRQVDKGMQVVGDFCSRFHKCVPPCLPGEAGAR